MEFYTVFFWLRNPLGLKFVLELPQASVWSCGTHDPRGGKSLILIQCGHFNNQLTATEKKNYEFLVRQQENRLSLVLMCPVFPWFCQKCKWRFFKICSRKLMSKSVWRRKDNVCVPECLFLPCPPLSLLFLPVCKQIIAKHVFKFIWISPAIEN